MTLWILAKFTAKDANSYMYWGKLFWATSVKLHLLPKEEDKNSNFPFNWKIYLTLKKINYLDTWVRENQNSSRIGYGIFTNKLLCALPLVYCTLGVGSMSTNVFNKLTVFNSLLHSTAQVVIRIFSQTFNHGQPCFCSCDNSLLKYQSGSYK